MDNSNYQFNQELIGSTDNRAVGNSEDFKSINRLAQIRGNLLVFSHKSTTFSCLLTHSSTHIMKGCYEILFGALKTKYEAFTGERGVIRDMVSHSKSPHIFRKTMVIEMQSSFICKFSTYAKFRISYSDIKHGSGNAERIQTFTLYSEITPLPSPTQGYLD
jgi:hypothetical protein